MAKVLLIGLEQSTATQIRRFLEGGRHEIQSKPLTVPLEEVLEADVVFADTSEKRYLPLLRAVRQKRPAMPFIAVSSWPDSTGWLDALEAGATDYCSPPIEALHVDWAIETAPLVRQAVAA